MLHVQTGLGSAVAHSNWLRAAGWCSGLNSAPGSAALKLTLLKVGGCARDPRQPEFPLGLPLLLQGARSLLGRLLPPAPLWPTPETLPTPSAHPAGDSRLQPFSPQLPRLVLLQRWLPPRTPLWCVQPAASAWGELALCLLSAVVFPQATIHPADPLGPAPRRASQGSESSSLLPSHLLPAETVCKASSRWVRWVCTPSTRC